MTDIHILVTCRNEELRAMSELVFKTVRVGFPSYNVVRTNNVNETHAGWISKLILNNDSPFWISDTDIIFYENMENISSNAAITGRYEPTFFEQWNQCIKTERIHTCLMLINPVKLRLELGMWLKKFDTELLEKFGFEFSMYSFVHGNIIPTPTTPLLYDTCSKLYSVVSCKHFTDNENVKFEHLHAGTYSDKVTCMKKELQTLHKIASEDVSGLRGLQLEQKKFYGDNKI